MSTARPHHQSLRRSLQGEVPKRLRGIIAKTHAALDVIRCSGRRFPADVQCADMGGFRIEITVGAPNLAKAREMILASGLLDPPSTSIPRISTWPSSSRRPLSPSKACSLMQIGFIGGLRWPKLLSRAWPSGPYLTKCRQGQSSSPRLEQGSQCGRVVVTG